MEAPVVTGRALDLQPELELSPDGADAMAVAVASVRPFSGPAIEWED
jgi:hypothetical protein